MYYALVFLIRILGSLAYTYTYNFELKFEIDYAYNEYNDCNDSYADNFPFTLNICRY